MCSIQHSGSSDDRDARTRIPLDADSLGNAGGSDSLRVAGPVSIVTVTVGPHRLTDDLWTVLGGLWLDHRNGVSRLRVTGRSDARRHDGRHGDFPARRDSHGATSATLSLMVLSAFTVVTLLVAAATSDLAAAGFDALLGGVS